MKIAILASAPSSRLLAPFNNPDWTIWACSPPNYDLPRVDAWFEVHSLDRKMANAANAPFYDKLKTAPLVYLAHLDQRLPNAVEYPIDAMVEKYDNYFFTSSVAYMLALAIEQKPEQIGLWGVDMSATEEYGYQRAGCHFFIREAKKAGIKVVAPPQSDILQPVPLYGWKEFTPYFWKAKTRRVELNQRIAEAQNLINQKTHEIAVLRGAQDAGEYNDNTWAPSR